MPVILDGKEYDMKDPDQKREYYRVYLKNWRTQNAEHWREYLAKRRSEPEARQKIREAQRRYYLSHPECYRAASRRYQYKRYHTDPEFRERHIAQCKARYHAKKAEVLKT